MHLHSRQTLLLSPAGSAAFEISKQLTNETCTSLVSLEAKHLGTHFSIVQEGLTAEGQENANPRILRRSFAADDTFDNYEIQNTV